jgi:hypothetical protein
MPSLDTCIAVVDFECQLDQDDKRRDDAEQYGNDAK